MSCKTKQMQAGGKTFSVHQMPMEDGLLLSAKLIKTVSPGIKKLSAVTESGTVGDAIGKIKGSNTEAIFDGIAEALENTEPETLVALVKEVVGEARCDGERIDPVNLDATFDGDMGLMFRVFYFVLKVNFSNFFGSWGIFRPSARG